MSGFRRPSHIYANGFKVLYSYVTVGRYFLDKSCIHVCVCLCACVSVCTCMCMCVCVCVCVLYTCDVQCYDVLRTCPPYQNYMHDTQYHIIERLAFMFHHFVYEHEICIVCMHRAKVAGSNEKAVDEGLLVMEHSRCMYMSILQLLAMQLCVQLGCCLRRCCHLNKAPKQAIRALIVIVDKTIIKVKHITKWDSCLHMYVC